MSTAIRPIETHYKGYRFRSRLEARWAVFFEEIGFEWEYEPEGYRLDGLLYLPDFFLPECEFFIEIKGSTPTEDEYRKARMLSAISEVLILSGDPLGAFAWFFSKHEKQNANPTNCTIELAEDGFWVDWDEERVDWDKPNFKIFGKRFELAAIKARSARFEHGETP